VAGNSPTPVSTPTPTPTPTPAVPTSGVTETKLPDVQATAYEHPGDAISLAYFDIERSKDNWVNYPRASRTGSFTRTEKYWTTSVSPDRTLEAGRTKKYTSRSYHAVEIIDRRTGDVRSVDLVKSPLTYDSAEWSKDSKRLLLTMKDPKKTDWATIGFIVVDVAAGKAKTTTILDNSIKSGRFYWTGDENEVVTSFTDGKAYGLRFYDLDGKRTREITGIGEPYNTSTGLFSPSGKSFVTRCPAGETGDCVWDTATGNKTTSISSSCTKMLGWYDESHLFCWASSADGGNQVNVIDLRGTALRVLLRTSAKDDIGPYYVREDAG
jgi:hypothetical protein